jgi:fructosamine-3-kinase
VSETFTKTRPGAPPGFFAVEAAGLDWLREAGAVAVPAVVEVGASHLIIERIDTGPWTPAADEIFGRQLAALHRAGAPTFGRPDQPDAWIGPLAQSNEPAESWAEFYWTRRVEPFVRSAGLPATPFEVGLRRLDDLAGPPEPPARIHGDLWRGNVLADRAGTPWLIDPAAHGGHRETDLAMMRLFGGFGDRCFAAYQETFPLAPGWEDRVALHQIHPLLVHAVLFGGHYGNQAIAAASRYA